MEPEPLSMRTSDYATGTIVELKSPNQGHRHGLKRPRPPCRHPSSFQGRVGKIHLVRCEATENELQVSGMTISKTSIRVLKVTYFEIIACPSTSMLKLKVIILKL